MSQSKVTASGGTVRTVGAAPSWESSQENEFAWEGWNIHIHPQGWLYFRDPVARVITDEDIRQPTTLRAVEEYIRTFPITELEEDMELLVPHDPRPDDHTFALAVNHALGLASRHIAEVKPKNLSRAEPHLLSRRKKMYWHFMERHPSHKAVPQGAEEEVKDALTWYHVDNLVAGARSTVPFSKVECEDLLRSLNSTKTDKVFNSPGRTVFLSWLLREIWSFRTSEAYGQYAFKLSSAERIKRIPTGPVPALPPPSIIRIPLRFVVNFLFFAIPNTYQDHVRQAGQYQGRLSTVQYNWERYTRRLVQEYQDFLLIATVLLSQGTHSLQSDSRFSGNPRH
ncbi:hypothetical protein BV25DRAFT_65802 [Artomyces pyxidatus]|uniref:Uncharacterized protein n=1 Tax=Artomyces pyxidatus TaxID=48021 RepID=A0ACB8TKK3_9AGAM|nr:hypothetical protein BV25DRAFT_65802 [Artomyces pyxidatus]